MNVLAKFENDAWQITDQIVLTGLDRRRSADDNTPEPLKV